MEKKRLFTTIGAIALTGVLAATATFAVLNDVTETKRNTFSSSKNISTELTEEEFWEKGWTDYYPGQSQYKTPVLTNNSPDTTSDIYTAVRISYIGNDGKRTKKADFENYATFQYKVGNNFVNGFNLINWELAKTYDDGSELYVYKGTLAPNASTVAIFDQVTVNAGITGSLNSSLKTTTVYKADANGNKILDDNKNPIIVSQTDTLLDFSATYVDEDGNKIENAVSLPSFDVEVKGFAVQAATFTTYTEAAVELTKLSDANMD